MSQSRFQLSLLFLLLITSLAQAQVLPADRRVNWQDAGLESAAPKLHTGVDIRDFGAIGDGLTDDYPALQAALESLDGAPGLVHIPSGTFRITETVYLPPGAVIHGAGADQTVFELDFGISSKDGFVAGSTFEGPLFNFTVVPQKGDALLRTVTAHGFKKNDWIEIIQDNGSWDSSPAVWAAESIGHISRVKNASGDSLLLVDPLRLNLTAGDNPRIRKIEPALFCGIENLKIKRTASAPAGSNILFNLSANCWVRGVESFKSAAAHILVGRSAHVEISGNYFHEAWAYDGTATSGYGVTLLRHASLCLVENNIFRKLRHAMMVKQGSNGNVFAYNYSREPQRSEFISDYTGDISLHGHFPFANLFEGNIVQNIFTDDYWGPSGPNNTFYRNRAERYGVVMTSGGSNSQNYIGNEITNTGFLLGNYILAGADHFEMGNLVQGTFVPAGSSPPAAPSLFRTDVPGFWNISDTWLSIGNGAGSTIPAKARWDSGAGLVYYPQERCDPAYLLSADSVSSASVILNWQHDVASSFQVRARQLGSGGWSTVTSGTNSFCADGLLNEMTIYEWQVRSLCAGTASPPSRLEEFTTPAMRMAEQPAVLPNPATDKIFISGESDWMVFDIYGRLIASGTGAQWVDIAEWTSGLYIVCTGYESKQLSVY